MASDKQPKPTLTLLPAEVVVPLRRNELGHILPGQRALNPGGKPRGLARLIREQIGETGISKCIEVLADIAYGKLSAVARFPDRMAAIQILLERAYGKPTQTVEVTNPGLGAAAVSGVPVDRLIAMRSALHEMLAAAKRDTPQDAEIVEDEGNE